MATFREIILQKLREEKELCTNAVLSGAMENYVDYERKVSRYKAFQDIEVLIANTIEDEDDDVDVFISETTDEE